jgi:hypothetical protein
MQFSVNASHLPSPHTAAGLQQSAGHVSGVSVGSQMLLPQPTAQSVGQVTLFSKGSWQEPSPHSGFRAFKVQSAAHVAKFSVRGSQTPSPQKLGVPSST